MQQQMNEGSGGCGGFPQQDSNVTGRDMRRRFVIKGPVSGGKGREQDGLQVSSLTFSPVPVHA